MATLFISGGNSLLQESNPPSNSTAISPRDTSSSLGFGNRKRPSGTGLSESIACNNNYPGDTNNYDATNQSSAPNLGQSVETIKSPLERITMEDNGLNMSSNMNSMNSSINTNSLNISSNANIADTLLNNTSQMNPSQINSNFNNPNSLHSNNSNTINPLNLHDLQDSHISVPQTFDSLLGVNTNSNMSFKPPSIDSHSRGPLSQTPSQTGINISNPSSVHPVNDHRFSHPPPNPHNFGFNNGAFNSFQPFNALDQLFDTFDTNVQFDEGTDRFWHG